MWYPISSPQTTALASPAQILMYGGASGGGKTDVLVADACQERDNKNLRAIIIRKSFTEMAQIMDRTRELYSQMGAYWRGHPHNHWLFPSGAQVRLGYMASEDHVPNFQGNPFSYLGVDESTHQTEPRIRRLIPWLASIDPSLRVRARLATNPGSIGADWHISVFLRSKCPVHYPEESAKPGAIYRGAKWPSDNKTIGKTVSFIPAKVEDNPLYGQDKLDALNSQEAAVVEKLLTGCWCNLEGRYFAFLTPDFMRPYAEAHVQWWWTFYISIDYGFGGSSAAAGLYAVSEIGVTYKIHEILQGGMGSEDFAKEVCSQWALRKIDNNPCRITHAQFDPANDSHTGTGKSNFEIMRDVFDKYDIPCIKSAKDRVGNAQNLFKMLKNRALVICDTAPKSFRSLSTRMHDPKTFGDVLKVKGDPLDDLYDETSYAANTFADDSEKPRDVQIAEKIREMKERGLDEHSVAINEMRMRMEIPTKDAPTTLGRGARKPIILR